MLKKTIAVLLLTLPMQALADTSYLVREGDTVLKIADKIIGAKKDPRRYAVAKKILALNPGIEDSNLLSPGQSIVVPDSFDKKPSSASAEVVTKKNPKVIPVIMDENDKSTVEASSDDSEEMTEAAPGKQPIIVPPEDKATSAAALESVIAASAKKSEEKPSIIVPASPPPPPPPSLASSGFLLVQPLMDFSDYKITNKSTDREVNVKSRLSSGLRLQYGINLKSDLHFIVGLGADYTQLDQFDDGTTSLAHTIQWQKTVNAMLAYDLGTQWHLLGKIEGADRLFVLPNGTNSFDTENVFIPGAALSINWDFLQTHSFLLGASVGGHYFGEASKDGITYKSSLDPSASLYWKSRGLQTLNYRVGVDYLLRNQDTDTTKQREETFIFGLTIVAPFHFGN